MHPSEHTGHRTVLLALLTAMIAPWLPISPVRAQEISPQAVAALFKPLPMPASQPEPLVALGRRLYSDTLLSINRTISCNSCHDLARFGADGEKTSLGHGGQRGDRNSPTTFNSALHVAQFWDGRAKDVEEQALGPMMNPLEMGMPAPEEVVKRLKETKGYPNLFAAAFPDEENPISFPNVGKAIGAFERTLVTPGRFDAFLRGDEPALTSEEKKGLSTFMTTGCIACHNGPLLGGSTYQKMGMVKPYPSTDVGRFKVTGREEDKFFFKVPSLRNIAETGPYFHDGSASTLNDAVTLMARHQLGKELAPGDSESIITFLRSLTGKLPE